ncbi:MAG: T9SS type A sorting domain-containing protein [Crocinitomicaceae bacterium]
MKKGLLFAFGLACSTFSFTQQTSAQLDVGGVTRDYIYYQPSGYTGTTPVPVLFVYHGLGDNASNMAQAGFNQMSDTANFIPVYMQGTLNILNQTAWNNGTALSTTTDDLAFTAQVLDSIQAWYNIDPDRIYACGFSMGGIMAHHLYCANDEFDAIGSVGGPIATSNISGCARTNPARVLHVHGTADQTVPYDGTALPSLSLVPETLNFWKGYSNCQDSTICRITDVAADNITVDYIEYNTCDPNNELVHYRMNGADHIWPYPPANDIWAAKVIWNFLQGQPTNYGCTSVLGIEEQTQNFELNLYPNPATNHLTIETDAEINAFEISNVEGKVVEIYTGLKTNQHTFSLSNLKQGGIFKIRTDKGQTNSKIH